MGKVKIVDEAISLRALEKKIVSCQLCPRLRRYGEQVAQTKKRAFLDQNYWGRPVPGFGSDFPRLWIVGLAPAAHGANRTGRMFTGDQSGLWLYRALYRAGFASHEKSVHREDDLILKETFISAVVRCAPPDNRPEKSEIDHCRTFLELEKHRFEESLKVCIALGGVAWNALRGLFQDQLGSGSHSWPKFGHGVELKLNSGVRLLASYHPSQQNTFTKKLTEPMFDQIFERARTDLANSGPAASLSK